MTTIRETAALSCCKNSGDQWDRDNAAYAAWCERHGLEVVMFKGGVYRMLGDCEPARVLGRVH